MNSEKQLFNILTNLNHALSLDQLAIIQEACNYYIQKLEEEE